MGIASDQQWMREALACAEQAQALDEVPVGAVVVLNNHVIARGFNQPISHHDPTAHAEIVALRAAAQVIGNYRLLDTTLYITLEPCAMCAGAIIHARVKRVVFGAIDTRGGAVQSILRLFDAPQLNHRVVYEGGVLEKECGDLLRAFFQARR